MSAFRHAGTAVFPGFVSAGKTCSPLRSYRPSTPNASTETAMVFGELYCNGAEWKFRAIGQGYASGLAGIAQDFGLSL
ncbi:TerD family protein [Streptomyces sp. NPDC005480]|uniref:TerD family protein n=1 Tax=Streptomyces sp. NPDC005480 TaxID=3154880 RepID=UPI0033BA09DB